MKKLIANFCILGIFAASIPMNHASADDRAAVIEKTRSTMIEGYDQLSRMSDAQWNQTFNRLADELEKHGETQKAKTFRELAKAETRADTLDLIKERIDSSSQNGVAILMLADQTPWWAWFTPFMWILAIITLDGSEASVN